MRSWPAETENQPVFALPEESGVRRLLRQTPAITGLLLATWLLLGPLPYSGSRHMAFIGFGPDTNVPYNWKLGVLGYAEFRHWHINGKTAGIELTTYNLVTFLVSATATCCLWFGYYRLQRMQYETAP